MTKNIINDPRTESITETFEQNIVKLFNGSGISIQRIKLNQNKQICFKVLFNNMFVNSEQWIATPMLITIIHDEVSKAYKGLDFQVSWNDKKTKFFIAPK